MVNTELDKAWRSTCKILFREEIGSYSEYVEWLAEFVDPLLTKKSGFSGKEVVYSNQDYSPKAKCISLDEVDENKKFELPNISDIKDIDSIVEAIQDRIYYAGNMILGNSKYVEKSSNINDSFYVHNTSLSGNSKYLGFCTLARVDTHGFGGNAFSQCEFCLKCHELTRVKRSFELWMSQDCADCYYSHGLKNCSNCFFCFNIENKRYAVGNLELGPEKYQEIKNRLIKEMLAVVKSSKRLPSLLEIIKKAGKKVSAPLTGKDNTPEQKLDKTKIEQAFVQTMQIIFKKKPSNGIDLFGSWLVKHTRGLEKCQSAASGKDLFLAEYGNYADLPKNRLLTIEEAKKFGSSAKLGIEEVQNLTFENVHERIEKIAFFNSDIEDGQCINDIDCTINIDAVNCYRTVCSVYSKYCAFSFWPRSSQYIFGCDTVFDSSFCINCYRSVNLQRCFEMDSCNSCADSLFCHNCENMQNSMFCFNTKNKQYAIGNVTMEPAKYIQIKERIVEQIYQELEKTGKFRYDIFSL